MHHLRLFPVFLQVAASHLATSLNKDTLHETELPAAFPSITAPQPVGGGSVVLLHDNTFIISWGEKTIRLGITAKSEKQGSLLIWRMVDLTPSALAGLLRRLVASCVHIQFNGSCTKECCLHCFLTTIYFSGSKYTTDTHSFHTGRCGHAGAELHKCLCCELQLSRLALPSAALHCTQLQ